MFAQQLQRQLAHTSRALLHSPRPSTSILALPLRAFTTSRPSPRHHSPFSPPIPTTEEEPETAPKKHAIGRINRRLQITFTCTASIHSDTETEEASVCGHRSTHEFSRRSYEKGIVLIECPGCKNRHLIADNLSWFSSTPSHAHPQGLPIGTDKPHRTVEDLMKEKGEQVKWEGGGLQGGTWELEG